MGLLEVRRLPEPALAELDHSLFYDQPHATQLGKFIVQHHKLGEQGISARVFATNGAVLLSGPPGSGKSTLAISVCDRIARKSGREAVLLVPNLSQIPSAELGGTPKNVRACIDRMTEIAQANRQRLVFALVDEVESAMPSRDRMDGRTEPTDSVRQTNEFLTGMERLGQEAPNMVVIATTNIPEFLDAAAADRFSLELFIGLPKSSTRLKIIRHTLSASGNDPDIAGSLPRRRGILHRLFRPADLVSRTKGYSCRDLRQLVLRALLLKPTDEALCTAHLVEAARQFNEVNRYRTHHKGMFLHDYRRAR